METGERRGRLLNYIFTITYQGSKLKNVILTAVHRKLGEY